MFKNTKSGITLLEVMVIIFLTIIISTIVFTNLSSFKKEQMLRNTASDIITFLNKAKQNTLSSVNSSSYGVHFESNRMILFSGNVYSSSGADNEIVEFDNLVSIPSTDGLNIGGGSDVVFERLTGDTVGGTIKLQRNDDYTKFKIINISKTGLISL